MVEETPVETVMFEYRLRGRDGKPGALIACALSDVLNDGLSMVYSFFHPAEAGRSLGTYMIMDHVRAARAREDCRSCILAIGCATARRWATRAASDRLKHWGPAVGRAFTKAAINSPRRRSVLSIP